MVCDVDIELLLYDDLWLLVYFDFVEEWVMELGDILYVLLCVVYNGVVVGDDCMMYFVGFCVFVCSELIVYYVDYLLVEIVDDDCYVDLGLYV